MNRITGMTDTSRARNARRGHYPRRNSCNSCKACHPRRRHKSHRPLASNRPPGERLMRIAKAPAHPAMARKMKRN